MRRLLLPLIAGSALSLALVACGDDSTSTLNCGAGTIEQNGQCVAVTEDTTGGTDTTGTTDTFTTDDTGGLEDTGSSTDDTMVADTEDPNSCTTEEASILDVGAGCSKDCECRQDLGLSCKSFDYYLPGFKFCTKNSDGTLKDTDGYVSLLFPSACFGGTPQSNRPPLYQHICSDVAYCKTLSAQYTHCGTATLSYMSNPSVGTECADDSTGSTAATLNLQKTCVIEGVLPFAAPE